MVGRVIVHIGDSKTGSTALQSVLRQGRSMGGWFYPGAHLNHNQLARCLSRPKLAHLAAARFRQIWQEISTSTAPVAVLSGEQFQAVDPSRFAEAMDAYWTPRPVRVIIVAYCRPHLSKLAAMYSERMKFGQNVGTFDHYAAHVMKTRRLDYAPRFAKWRDTFGEAFTLRPYMSSHLPNGDVVQDFFATALPECPTPKSTLRVNMSMTQQQVALLKRVEDIKRSMGVPEALPPDLYRLMCLNLRASGIGQSGAALRMSRSMRRAVQTRYQADALAVDKASFEAEVLVTDLNQERAKSPTTGGEILYPEDVSWFDTMVRNVLSDWSVDPAQTQRLARQTLNESLV